MTDPSLLAALIFLVLWVVTMYFYRADKHTWDAERTALLDRIQARSAAEYKAFREIDEPKRPVVRREPVYQSHAVAPGATEPAVDIAGAQITFGRLAE